MLICVTLNDRDDWQDHERLYDYGFGQLTPAEVSFPTDWSIAVAGGTAQQVTLIPEGTIVAGTRDGKAPALEFQLETAPFLYAPVTAGQDAGTWKALCGGELRRRAGFAPEKALYIRKNPRTAAAELVETDAAKDKKGEEPEVEKFEFKSCWQMPAIVPGGRQNS